VCGREKGVGGVGVCWSMWDWDSGKRKEKKVSFCKVIIC
jgi:hypothetical protein